VIFSWTRTFAIRIGWALLLGFFLAFGTSDGAVRSAPSGNQEAVPDEDPHKKWERLSDQEKKELLNKYYYYKSLPDSQRSLLKERHKKLKAIQEGLDDFDAPFGQDPLRVREGRKEPYHRVKRFLKGRLNAVQKKIKASLPEAEDDRIFKIRKLRQELEDLNQEQIDPFLNEMVERGIVQPEEVDSIKRCPHRERRERLFGLNKRRHLREMEGLLPPSEEDGLKRMEPWRFHMDQWGLRRPGARLGALTQEQEKLLQNVPVQGMRQIKKQFVEENVRSRLEQLGVDPGELDPIFALPRHERERSIMRKLRALKAQGVKIPEEWEEEPSGRMYGIGYAGKSKRSESHRNNEKEQRHRKERHRQRNP